MNREYAVYQNGTLVKSSTWYPTKGISLVTNTGLIFPLDVYVIEFADDFNYLIDEYIILISECRLCTADECSSIINTHTIIKCDDDGNKMRSSDDEVCKNIADDLPDINQNNFKVFTKAVIMAIKQHGHVIPISVGMHNKRTAIIRKLKGEHYINGVKDITIPDAEILLNSCNLTLSDILNEKYIY